jgi:histidinol-phosphate aminotransferase
MGNFSFIRPEIAKIKAYTPHPGGEVVNLSLDRLDTNESPYDLSQELKEKLAFLYQKNIETNRYPNASHYELKKAIASYVNESGNSHVTIDNISVGNGSDELIRSLLIATCLNNSGSILVADPTFSMYAILAETLGINVVKVGRSESDFSIDLEAANKAMGNEKNRIKVIFVVHPNSPTGNALTAEEKDWLRSISEDILVVIDEAYFEFSQDTLVSELKYHPNWIILRTFSKAFRLASLRVGYAIAHLEIVRALEKIRLPYNLPSFSQTAALLTLNERQSILATIPETIKEREKLYNNLSKILDLKIWASAANFVFLRFKNNQEMVEKLKQEGTLIRHTCNGLRITIGTPEENERTIKRIINNC